MSMPPWHTHLHPEQVGAQEEAQIKMPIYFIVTQLLGLPSTVKSRITNISFASAACKWLPLQEWCETWVIYLEISGKISKPRISSICNQVLLSLIHAEQGICRVKQVILFIIMSCVFKQSVLCIIIHHGWKAVHSSHKDICTFCPSLKPITNSLKLHSELNFAHQWGMRHAELMKSVLGGGVLERWFRS